ILQTQSAREFNLRQPCHEIAEKSSRIVPRARSIDLDDYAHAVCRAGLPWSVRYPLLSRMASQTASHGSTGALRDLQLDALRDFVYLAGKNSTQGGDR